MDDQAIAKQLKHASNDAGNLWTSETIKALELARWHRVTTNNDRDCLTRLLYGGGWRAGDRERLAELADYILENKA